MKATIKGKEGFEMNCDYLDSVGSVYTYFYVPDSAMSAELFRAVGEDIVNIRRSSELWQIQVRTESIIWED